MAFVYREDIINPVTIHWGNDIALLDLRVNKFIGYSSNGTIIELPEKMVPSYKVEQFVSQDKLDVLNWNEVTDLILEQVITSFKVKGTFVHEDDHQRFIHEFTADNLREASKKHKAEIEKAISRSKGKNFKVDNQVRPLGKISCVSDDFEAFTSSVNIDHFLPEETGS